MKAVLYRRNINPGGADQRIVLMDNAVAIHQVVGEIVTIRRSGGDITAAVRLGERDYITFEQEDAKA